MATALPTTSTTSRPTSVGALPAGLLVYLGGLLTAMVVTLFAYQNHSDFWMVTWRIALGTISNISCALLGCYLVLRRMSLLGDAISHAVLPGIVIAFLLTGQLGGIWILVGAAAIGLITAVLTQALSASGQVAEDSSMGIVYTGLFAAGVLLVNYFARQTHIDPDCVLYGAIDVSTIGGNEVPHGFYRLLIVLVATTLAILIFWKELKLVAFDPALAQAMGFRVNWVHYGLMAFVAIATVAAFEVVGSILVVAMLIVPAATASLLTERLHVMLLWAAAIAAGSAFLGDFAGAMFNTSIAGMMTEIAGLHLIAAIFLAPRGGLISRWWRNLQLSLRIVREDILATLFRLEEQATDSPRPRPVTWLTSVARWQLCRQGLLEKTPAGWGLTQLGRDSARSIVRAHRLWETYLQKHFDLPADHLHEPAERMEHFLDEQLQAELMAELKHETHDPHGRAIPEHGSETNNRN